MRIECNLAKLANYLLENLALFPEFPLYTSLEPHRSFHHQLSRQLERRYLLLLRASSWQETAWSRKCQGSPPAHSQ